MCTDLLPTAPHMQQQWQQQQQASPATCVLGLDIHVRELAAADRKKHVSSSAGVAGKLLCKPGHPLPTRASPVAPVDGSSDIQRHLAPSQIPRKEPLPRRRALLQPRLQVAPLEQLLGQARGRGGGGRRELFTDQGLQGRLQCVQGTASPLCRRGMLASLPPRSLCNKKAVPHPP